MIRRTFVAVCGLVVLSTMTGCRMDSVSGVGDVVFRDGKVSGTGTVRYGSLEGGYYYIVGDDNKPYGAMNLPSEFRQDGLRIRFSGRLRDDILSFYMSGPFIELDHVELR